MAQEGLEFETLLDFSEPYADGRERSKSVVLDWEAGNPGYKDLSDRFYTKLSTKEDLKEIEIEIRKRE